MPKKSAHQAKTKRRLILRKEIAFFCTCCAAIILLALSTLNIRNLTSSDKVLGVKSEIRPEEIEQISKEIIFWKEFLGKTPSYFDGWLELSTLEMELGNKDEAVSALNMAEKIDPNSRKLKLVEDSLPK